MIEIKDISFSYPDGDILKGVGFTAERGEVVGLLGNNGAGKSTFVTCLNRIRKPKTGSLTIDGKEYLLMKALKADFAILNAHLVDKNGNMWFKGTTRNFNPLMATAGETVIVEADNVVECGDILPENVHTTGAVVNYIVDGGKE